MSRFSQKDLDDIRAALKPSVVLGRYMKLKKEGSEYRAVDDHSLTINDHKGLWWNHGAGTTGEEGGDIFKAEEIFGHCSFPEAVERLASQAGVRLNGGGSSGHHEARRAATAPSGSNSPGINQDDDTRQGTRPKRTIKATYDYTDRDGGLIYQVVRWEPKNFSQRRPAPGEPGVWIWALDAGEYMRRPPDRMDWIRLDEANFKKWKFTERQRFDDDVAHGLYLLPELVEWLGESDGPYLLPEGEKDVHTLVDWDLMATTNSGGAKNWRPDHAQFFAGKDVVIIEDADLPDRHGKIAGEQRTAKMAPGLAAVARSVKVLNLKKAGWAECPDGGDVTDWKERAGGTRAKLLEIIARLPAWAPPAFESRFGVIRWGEQYQGRAERYEFLIPRLIPRREGVLIIGPSQSGKSYWTFDLCRHVVTGEPFRGQRVRRGGVVYCAVEKGRGFRTRMHAMQKHFELPLEGVPMAVLTKPFSLFDEQLGAQQLVEEILAVSAEWDVPLEVVVIDTNDAATPGMSEIDKQDLTRIKDCYQMIMDRTQAGCWIVYHTNAQGHYRGSLVLWNAVDTAIEIARQTDKQIGDIKDNDGRSIRTGRVAKLSEGESGYTWDFVLKQVKVGTNEFGEDDTACVVLPPARAAGVVDDRERAHPMAPAPSGFVLKGREVSYIRALLKAIGEEGIAPPPELQLPLSIAQVVDYEALKRAYVAVVPYEGEPGAPKDIERWKWRIRDSLKVCREPLIAYGAVGIAQLKDGRHVIWPTGKRVVGKAGFVWPRPPKPVEPEPLPAGGADDPIF